MRIAALRVFAVILLANGAAVGLRAQGPIVLGRSPSAQIRMYQNSADGLRWQLQDLLNAARKKDQSAFNSLVRQTELPNSKQWFTVTFGSKGLPWADSYSRNLNESGKELADAVGRLVDRDGEFAIRSVNRDPAPARTIEAQMVDALQRPIEILFASWRDRNAPPGTKSISIGYFVFVEGNFRRSAPDPTAFGQVEDNPPPGESSAGKPLGGSAAQGTATAGVAMPKNAAQVARPGTGGIGYPSCDACPDPAYSNLARSKRLEGTVILEAVIQRTGEVTDVRLVKSTDPELTQMAIDGVSRWHMNPARMPDGEPVPVLVPIEITFRLKK